MKDKAAASRLIDHTHPPPPPPSFKECEVSWVLHLTVSPFHQIFKELKLMGFISLFFFLCRYRTCIDWAPSVMISESGQAAIVAILSILAIIDIIGNSLVCVVITRNPDMRSVGTKLSNDGCYMQSKKHVSLICPPPRSHQGHIFLA